MERRLTLLLALVLACSTVLAGVPLITAAAAPDPQSGPCVAPLPFDPEGLSEARGETVEEEREEEGADAELDLFTRPLVAVVVDLRESGLTALDSLSAAAGSSTPAWPIRGPPAS